ncbi:ThiF family adenylyltransferase [Variovorax paradoxus]|uniref:ThiF family adenylyltransferase n=1 Tax=Variovorax paradoxus TaxID=34073 RepID=UPI003D661841
MTTWWSRYPAALDRERHALDERGFSWSTDEEAFAKGRFVVNLEVRFGGVERQLSAYYPDTYPYFAPQVVMSGDRLQRHHNLDGFLCLLERDGEDWIPDVDTLASVLCTQLQKIEQVNQPGADAALVAQQEEPAGEPISNFLPYLMPPEVLLIPDETPSADVAKGRLEVLLHPGAKAKSIAIGAVNKILDKTGKVILQNPVASPHATAPASGFWCRLQQRPVIGQIAPETLHKLFHELLLADCPELGKALSSARRGDMLFGGVVYRDEVSWRTNKDDWVFMKYEVTRERKGARAASFKMQFVRSDWSGEETFLQRAPFMRPLRNKSVLLIGAGNVGSPVAIQLARAGVRRLDIVDPDVLQAGNTVRWALGRREAGQFKAYALAAYIGVDFPLTEAHPHAFRIGHCATKPEDIVDYFELTRTLIEKADLVIDATASFRASYFIADMAKSLDKPYLWLTTTHGAAGGVVGRILPGHTAGCWHCFQRCLGDGSIRLPADSGAEEVQPGGCTHPTFIGAGLDSDEIAILASRLAVATLCRGDANGYGDFDWDVAVGDLQMNGRSTAPNWSIYPLNAHPGCRACGQNHQ